MILNKLKIFFIKIENIVENKIAIIQKINRKPSILIKNKGFELSQQYH